MANQPIEFVCCRNQFDQWQQMFYYKKEKKEEYFIRLLFSSESIVVYTFIIISSINYSNLTMIQHLEIHTTQKLTKKKSKQTYSIQFNSINHAFRKLYAWFRQMIWIDLHGVWRCGVCVWLNDHNANTDTPRKWRCHLKAIPIVQSQSQ